MLAHPSSFVIVYDQNNQTQCKILAHGTYKGLLVVTKRTVTSKRSALGQGSALVAITLRDQRSNLIRNKIPYNLLSELQIC